MQSRHTSHVAGRPIIPMIFVAGFSSRFRRTLLTWSEYLSLLDFCESKLQVESNADKMLPTNLNFYLEARCLSCVKHIGSRYFPEFEIFVTADFCTLILWIRRMDRQID